MSTRIHAFERRLRAEFSQLRACVHSLVIDPDMDIKALGICDMYSEQRRVSA